jgi:hypothetical protein
MRWVEQVARLGEKFRQNFGLWEKFKILKNEEFRGLCRSHGTVGVVKYGGYGRMGERREACKILVGKSWKT